MNVKLQRMKNVNKQKKSDNFALFSRNPHSDAIV